MKKLTTLALTLIIQVYTHAEQQLTIGVEEINYFPYYTLEDGVYRGFLRDIMDTFAKQHNYKIHYMAHSPAELTNALIKDTVGFAMPDNDYWSADKKKGQTIIYSDPIVTYTDGAFVKKRFVGASIDRIKKIGIISGFNPYPYYERIEQNKLKAIKYKTISEVISGLITDEVDAIYFNKLMTIHYLFNMNLETLAQYPPTDHYIDFDPNLPHINSTFKLSTIKHQDVVDKLNTYLQENWKNISALRARYNISK